MNLKTAVFCVSRTETLYPINQLSPDCLLSICGKTPLEMCGDALSEYSSEAAALVVGRWSAKVSISSPHEHRMILADETLGASFAEYADGNALLITDAAYSDAPDIAALIKGSSGLVTGCSVLVSRTGNGLPIRSENGMLTVLNHDVLSDNTDTNGYFAGAVLISAELCTRLGVYDFSCIEELLHILLAEDEHMTVVYTEKDCLRLITPEDYRKACFTAAELQKSTAQSFYGRGAVVEENSITDNCVIGDNVSIGRRCSLRGCVIGESSTIAAGTEGKNVVIGECCKIGASVTFGDGCVIGSGTSIGSGSVIKAGAKVAAGSRITSGEYVAEKGVRDISPDSNGWVTADTSDTPLSVVRIGMACAALLDRNRTVVIGCGEENAAISLSYALAAGFCSSGITPYFVGECAPMELTYLISRLGASLGCFVTAEGQCSIRVTVKGGLPLSDTFRCKLRRAYSFGLFRTAAFTDQPTTHEMKGAGHLYLSYLSGILPTHLKGVNAAVRASQAAMLRISESLLKNCCDTDAARIVFDVSNDGMTCSASSAKSGLVTHEQLVLIAAEYAFSRDQAVSLPASFPTAADIIAERCGGKLYRYPLNYTEENSHPLETARRPDNFFVRDALALVCMVCAYLSETGRTLENAVAALPEFSTVRRFIPYEIPAAEAYSILGAVREDGGGTVTGLGGRASLQPVPDRSGLMIFAEAASSETAAALCEDIIKRLKDRIS